MGRPANAATRNTMQLYTLCKRRKPQPTRAGSREMQAEELERRRDTVDELPFSANTRDTMNAIINVYIQKVLHQIPGLLYPPLSTLYFL